MDRTKHIIAAIGLAMGVVFGLSGTFLGGPQGKLVLYGISSLGLVVAACILALHFYRKNEDLIAVGFLIFAIGEAVMMGGTPAGDLGGQPFFGAGMAMYMPALLLISIPKYFSVWNRLTGIAASIPFAIGGAIIFSGGEVLASSDLAGAAYGLLSITIIGWITKLLATSEVTSTSPVLEGQVA